MIIMFGGYSRSVIQLFIQLCVAQVIKREPGSLGARCWSLYGRCYLRHFNELDHELMSRLSKGYKVQLPPPVIPSLDSTVMGHMGGVTCSPENDGTQLTCSEQKRKYCSLNKNRTCSVQMTLADSLILGLVLALCLFVCLFHTQLYGNQRQRGLHGFNMQRMLISLPMVFRQYSSTLAKHHNSQYIAGGFGTL